MTGHFYFEPFRGKMLLTNDSGRYAFLSQNDFQLLINEDDKLDAELHAMLEEDGFCYSD